MITGRVEPELGRPAPQPSEDKAVTDVRATIEPLARIAADVAKQKLGINVRGSFTTCGL
jgi:hypothetical protein